MRLGLLGGGSIANDVARAVADGHLPNTEVVGVVGSSDPPSERVAATADLADAPICGLQQLLSLRPDVVFEAAGDQAVRTHLPRLAESEADLVVMSIGALLEPDLWALVERVRRRGRQVVLPSGAVAGLDGVAALNALGGLERVELTSTKAPAGWRSAPYLEEHGIELPADEARVLFEGSSAEAARGFPANMNVAAALSLAGIGPERTRVRLVSDPEAARTRHEIVAEGSGGRVATVVESAPNPNNPRSSYLASLSAIATLRSLVV